MIVDVSGLPGSGKSTITELVTSFFRNSGRQVVKSRSLVDYKMSSDITKSPFLGGSPSRRFSYRLARFRFEHPDYMREMDEIGNSQYKDYNLFCEMLTSYIVATQETDPNNVVIFDEGVIHRTCTIFRQFIFQQYGVEASDEILQGAFDIFSQLIENLPPIDICIFLEIPAQLSLDRATERAIKRKNITNESRKLDIRNRIQSKHGSLRELDFQNRLNQIAIETVTRKTNYTAKIQADQPVEGYWDQILDILNKFPS